MEKNRIGLHLIGAVAVSMALVGCADENPWGNTSGEKGSISLKLTTDYDFDTAKPVFRSGEGESGETRAALADYTSLPSAEAFCIKLEKNDGTMMKDWSSYDDFTAYCKQGDKIDAGLYTITAYYGNAEEQGADKPYFEAKSSFTVLPGQTANVEMTAELKNSLVYITYTEAFKNYMSEYSAKIVSGGATIEATADKAVFVKPDKAQVNVSFTTATTKKTATVSSSEFAPLAKTLHKITFDVNENNNGAELIIEFDEKLTTKDEHIDLTDELFTTPAPAVSCTGFTNGETVDTYGAAVNNVNMAMTVTAAGGIQSANLTVSGPADYAPTGLGTGANGTYTVDLCNAAGLNADIKATNFGGGSKGAAQTATLNLTDFVKNLPQGNEYTISLAVTDFNNKTNEPVSVKVNSENISVSRQAPTDASISEATFGSDIVNLKVAYNGVDPKEIAFQDDNGNAVQVNSIAYNGETVYTRAFETKVYDFTLKMPQAATKSKLSLKALRDNNEIGTLRDIPVTLPAYSISKVDAFARYAYMQVSTENAGDLAAVTEHITLDGLTIADRDNANGVLTVKGLTAGQQYLVRSSITGGDVWNNETGFTTEQELAIPNGDFSVNQQNALTSEQLIVGGKYYQTRLANYTNKSSYSYLLPANWYDINAETAKQDVSNYNTWYVVPSSWLDNGMGYMRNVGYNHKGRIIEDQPSNKITQYCSDHPSDEELQKAAGVLSVGQYDFTTSSSDGIPYSSRPTSISFDYQYKLEAKEKKSDEGYALIEILDSNDKSLGFKEFRLTPTDKGKESILLTYEKFGAKASKLKIVFKSSYQQIPPIHIPTGNELDDGKSGAGDKTIPTNSYHAVATGSELWIDNVTAHYDEP